MDDLAVVRLCTLAARRTMRHSPRRLDRDHELTRMFVDLEDHQPVQAEQLLRMSGTVRHARAPPRDHSSRCNHDGAGPGPSGGPSVSGLQRLLPGHPGRATKATTNTRCRRCKTVVRIGSSSAHAGGPVDTPSEKPPTAQQAGGALLVAGFIMLAVWVAATVVHFVQSRRDRPPGEHSLDSADSDQEED